MKRVDMLHEQASILRSMAAYSTNWRGIRDKLYDLAKLSDELAAEIERTVAGGEKPSDVR